MGRCVDLLVDVYVNRLSVICIQLIKWIFRVVLNDVLRLDGNIEFQKELE